MKKIKILLILSVALILSGCENITNIILDNIEDDVIWEMLDQKDIVLTNETINLTDPGVYTITGLIENGSINIDTEESIKLILDGVSITNNSGPAINIVNSNLTVIELKEGSNNTLSDTETRDDELDGCIYSSDDLIVKGKGSLTINANYLDGIVSKDDLKIVDGTYIINSSDDAIRGKDSIYILGGVFNINAGADGIKTTNDIDFNKGYVYIKDGTFDISVDDDAIHGEQQLIIDGGKINIIKSNEGIESPSIIINGGDISVVSADDGINASGGEKTNDDPGKMVINSGTIRVNANGDGLDANGTIIISGGNIYIDGPVDDKNAPIDYDDQMLIKGGKIISIGSKGMAQPASEESNQNSFLLKLEKNHAQNTLVKIIGDNKEIFSYQSLKSFDCIFFSSDNLIKNKEYSVIIDDKLVKSFTITKNVTNLNQ